MLHALTVVLPEWHGVVLEHKSNALALTNLTIFIADMKRRFL